jgi:hypothetical protein
MDEVFELLVKQGKIDPQAYIDRRQRELEAGEIIAETDEPAADEESTA